MKIYSSIIDAGVGATSRRSHESLLKMDGVVAPYVLLTCLRVKLFVRTVLHASDLVLSVLFEAQGGHRAWIDAVECDLKFLATYSVAFADMAGASVHSWVERIRLKPGSFNKALMSAVAEQSVNSPSAWARTKRLKELNCTFACELCPFTATCHSLFQNAWAPASSPPAH